MKKFSITIEMQVPDDFDENSISSINILGSTIHPPQPMPTEEFSMEIGEIQPVYVAN